MPGFTVDTHLFRELGEHLVGRDSTALLELLKNSYDADATVVTVTGEYLDDRQRGRIVVIDNGSGMDEQQFRQGFLRIAARTKEIGTRRSAYFQRRFTGAKGIGRLAAHKLAGLLQVESVWGVPRVETDARLVARIDWDAIERKESLDEITDEVMLEVERLSPPVLPGTRITLDRLRRLWTPEERTRFVSECKTILPPPQLTADLTQDLSPRLLSVPLLFRRPTLRRTAGNDEGFSIRLEGDFETGEGYWKAITETSEWVIEIDAARPQQPAGARIRYGISPTVLRWRGDPDLVPRMFEAVHPNPAAGPFFQARILVRVDPKEPPAQRQHIRGESGVRVYVEGFRILPYGEPGNDWLSLDSDYTRRSALTFADQVREIYGPDEADSHWESLLLPNRSYYGAVFLTQEDAVQLHPLINREGFLPNAAYEALQRAVRLGIDLFTRVRAASEYEERARRREERRRRQRPDGGTTPPRSAEGDAERRPLPTRQVMADALSEAKSAVEVVRAALAANNVEGARQQAENLPTRLDALQQVAERLTEEAPFFRVLASLGTQMSTFVHEIRSLIGTVETIHDALDRLRGESSLKGPTRKQLAVVFTAVGELKRSLERQASYLLDIATPDASRRRSRQSLADRFDAGARLVQTSAERRGIEIINDVPQGLKSPPMFPAELTTVFSNLLSNAVKAAGSGGRICGWATRTERGAVLMIENTGVAVRLDEAERWFRPFESTTTQVDSPLWQGMGLGLTITRNTLEEYGATIRFVPPSPGYATAVEITFPE